MRKTLNLDDDVAALLEKVCEATNATLNEVVNAALRLGLASMVEASPAAKKFRTKVRSAARCFLPNLDNTAEVLASAEGDQFK